MHFSLRRWKRNETKMAEEYCWAITGGGAVMLRPIGSRVLESGFQRDGLVYADILDHMYIHFRLAPDFPECNCLVCWGILLFVNYALQHLRLTVRYWLNVPTFTTRRFHACQHARAPSGGRWSCGREMTGNFT
jgi:hypothetical protein